MGAGRLLCGGELGYAAFMTLDDRFEAVERRFDALERRLDALDRRLVDLMEHMNRRFTALTWGIVIMFSVVIALLGVILARLP